MRKSVKKALLGVMLAGMLATMTGCFIQPDPTLDPLEISNGTVPFGTVQSLPTSTPTPSAQARRSKLDARPPSRARRGAAARRRSRARAGRTR